MKNIVATGIDHVAIDVTDVNRAVEFYGVLLGLREIPRPATFTFPGAWFQIGTGVLHIVGRAEPFAPAPHHFCLRVTDVHEAAKSLDAAGFPVEWDKRYKIPGIDRFFVRDPDGNRVEFQGAERIQPEPGQANSRDAEVRI